MPHNDMYTQEEACTYLNVTRQSLHYARKHKLLSGRVIGKRVILYTKDELDSYKKVMRKAAEPKLPAAPPIFSPNEYTHESEE